jgi:hypothetical protein
MEKKQPPKPDPLQAAIIEETVKRVFTPQFLTHLEYR